MKVHFIIHIGGSVMHQLAIALKRKGYQVSDLTTKFLNQAGAI